ncbi:hypothetical protein GYB29_16190 [bacterium]|nr:hypothetical protein [bacterium]
MPLKLREYIYLFLVLGLLACNEAPQETIYGHKSWNSDWSNIRPAMKDSIENFGRSNAISGTAVGPAGRTPRSWYTRQWIIKNVTQEELEQLKTNPNGAVKATVYETLILRSSGPEEQYNLIKEALADSTYFFSLNSGGCVGETYMVGEYIVEHVAYLPQKSMSPPPPSLPSDLRITDSFTQAQIDDLLQLYQERKRNKWEYFDERNFN